MSKEQNDWQSELREHTENAWIEQQELKRNLELAQKEIKRLDFALEASCEFSMRMNPQVHNLKNHWLAYADQELNERSNSNQTA